MNMQLLTYSVKLVDNWKGDCYYMPSFDKEFAEAQGKPVLYNGKSLLRLDRLEIGSKATIRITLEECNSNWHQGVHLRVDKGFIVEGKRVKDIRIWYNDEVKSVEYDVETKNGQLLVWNVWDVGDGVVHSWHNGAAMVIEDINNGRKYSCNDGHPDDNLNDLIFKIELINKL